MVARRGFLSRNAGLLKGRRPQFTPKMVAVLHHVTYMVAVLHGGRVPWLSDTSGSPAPKSHTRGPRAASGPAQQACRAEPAGGRGGGGGGRAAPARARGGEEGGTTRSGRRAWSWSWGASRLGDGVRGARGGPGPGPREGEGEGEGRGEGPGPGPGPGPGRGPGRGPWEDGREGGPVGGPVRDLRPASAPRSGSVTPREWRSTAVPIPD